MKSLFLLILFAMAAAAVAEPMVLDGVRLPKPFKSGVSMRRAWDLTDAEKAKLTEVAKSNSPDRGKALHMLAMHHIYRWEDHKVGDALMDQAAEAGYLDSIASRASRIYNEGLQKIREAHELAKHEAFKDDPMMKRLRERAQKVLEMHQFKKTPAH